MVNHYQERFVSSDRGQNHYHKPNISILSYHIIYPEITSSLAWARLDGSSITFARFGEIMVRISKAETIVIKINGVYIADLDINIIWCSMVYGPHPT